MTFFDLLNNLSTCRGRNGLIFFDSDGQDMPTLVSHSKKNWMPSIEGQRKTVGWKTEEIHDRTRTNHPYCLNSRITIPTLEMNSRPKVQEAYDDDEYFDLGNDSESD